MRQQWSDGRWFAIGAILCGGWVVYQEVTFRNPTGLTSVLLALGLGVVFLGIGQFRRRGS